MKKALFQFIVMVGMFFGTWLVLSRVNYVKHLSLKRVGSKNERKIGNWIMDNIRLTQDEITDEDVTTILDSLKIAICKPNHISDTGIKVHLIKSNEINAFALPGNHLVIYTGLIKYCHNASELCGVMGHEIGHMQHNHVMTRLMREMGFSVVLAAGSGNATVIRQMLKLLTSSAFDRKQESEADRSSVNYMIDAGIDPTALADFLERLAEKQEGMPEELEWISTHPLSKERAEAIRQQAKGAVRAYHPPINDSTWLQLREKAEE